MKDFKKLEESIAQACFEFAELPDSTQKILARRTNIELCDIGEVLCEALDHAQKLFMILEIAEKDSAQDHIRLIRKAFETFFDNIEQLNAFLEFRNDLSKLN